MAHLAMVAAMLLSADIWVGALIRRVDHDRWLATRFVTDREARDVQLALLALNYELARVGESVTNPLVGEIRLAWWREQLERLAGILMIGLGLWLGRGLKAGG